MSASLKGNITPRRKPQQQRAHTTIKAIFDAAWSILRNDGAASFTTRKLAELSGVNISSIYQYFPNKQSILYAMYEIRLQDVVSVLDKLDQPEYKALPWFEFFTLLFDEMDALQWSSKADVALSSAILHDEKLAKLEKDHRTKVIQRVASYLRHFGAKQDQADLESLAEYIYAIDQAAVDLMAEKPRRIKQQISKWSLDSYLRLIDDCINTKY